MVEICRGEATCRTRHKASSAARHTNTVAQGSFPALSVCSTLMEAQPTRLEGVLVLTPQLLRDDRGFFFESFNEQLFQKLTTDSPEFVQDNHSRSARGVLRGLHYQVPPHAQGKLIRCGRGRIFDVVVDIRRSSPTFGDWFGLEISDDNLRQLWVPEGFAHGFIALTDEADVLYKVTDYHDAECARSIRWDDPSIDVEWPIDETPQLSGKDRMAPLFSDAKLFE